VGVLFAAGDHHGRVLPHPAFPPLAQSQLSAEVPLSEAQMRGVGEDPRGPGLPSRGVCSALFRYVVGCGVVRQSFILTVHEKEYEPVRDEVA
jgi:hypothetical protein